MSVVQIAAAQGGAFKIGIAQVGTDKGAVDTACISKAHGRAVGAVETHPLQIGPVQLEARQIPSRQVEIDKA